MKANRHIKLFWHSRSFLLLISVLLCWGCEKNKQRDVSNFNAAFDAYVSRMDDAFSACETYNCINALSLPVYEIDTAGRPVFWNAAALTISVPDAKTSIVETQKTTYLLRSHEHWRYLIPLRHKAEAQQQKWLSTEIGPYFRNATYAISAPSSSRPYQLDHISVQPSLGWKYILIYFFGLSLLFLLIIRQSKFLIGLIGDWYGSVITILLLICSRLLFGNPTIMQAFADHTIFQHRLSGWVFSPSLGELFLNMLLFFVITIFLFRTFDDRPIRRFEGGQRWAVLISGYLLVIGSILSFVYVTKQVVIGSSIDFQFDKIYVLDANTHVFIISVLLFICSLFFISYLLIKTLGKTGTRFIHRLISFFIAAVITIPIFLRADMHISAIGFYILVLSILSLMDLFVESKQKSISWLVLWLVTIASGTTALLYAHNSIAYFSKAEAFAKDLSQQSTKDTPQDVPSVYDWALFESWEIIGQDGQPPLEIVNEKNIPPAGLTRQIKNKQYQAVIHRSTPGTVALVSRSHDQVIQFISLFSFLFTSLILIVLLVFILHSIFPFIPKQWNIRFNRRRSIRRRIQYVIFSVLVISFATVFAVTSFYMQDLQANRTDDMTADQRQGIQFIQSYFNQLPVGTDIATLPFRPTFNFSYAIYTMRGKRLITNQAEQATIYPPYSMTTYADRPASINMIREHNYSHAFQQVRLLDQPFIVEVSSEQSRSKDNYLINNLLGTLLNLYIFLFVIASSLALAFSDTITRPLLKLREKFSSVTIGRSNEPIDYDSDDEVGELIKDYNRMLTKIEDSVNTLAMTERELAWREMAKQVAHEIKNPLTPMKLSLQHLQFAIKRDPDRAEELINRVGKTLLEQIDNLSRIASEFSNFAKMPKPENKQVVLNDIASSVHDLFRKRADMDINLYIPIDEIYVFGDPHYMTRVLINLLKNATQAIPPNRRGVIDIHVYKEEDDAIIKVTDNGTGIPKEIRDKVFQPNFTSKNSGTGLGLAICANIIESFNGKIYFETTVDIGTTFFIEIPLMHKEENFKTENRVIL